MPKPIGWDTARDNLEAGYERTHHRRDEDLPDIPDLDPTPDLDLDPSRLKKAVDVFREQGREAAREQVADLADQLLARAQVEHPEFYAKDKEPAPDPLSAMDEGLEAGSTLKVRDGS